MTFEEFAAERMPGVLRFAAVLAGDRATAEDLAVIVNEYIAFPGTTAMNAVPGFPLNP